MLLSHALRAAAKKQIQYIGLSSVYGTGSSATCNVPANAQAGDFLFAVSTQLGSTATRTMTPPSDWTGTLDEIGRWAGYLASWNGTTSSYTFTKSGTSDPVVVMLAFRNASYDVNGSLSGGSTTPTAPSITLSSDDSTVIACFSSLSSTGGAISYTTPTGFTEVFDDARHLSVNYKQNFFSGDTGTVTSTASQGTASRGFLFGIKPL
jgi:hypothetical protein